MPESDFEQRLHTERLEKLRQIAELGAKHGLSAAEATYPNHFRFTTTVPELRAAFDNKSAEELAATHTEVAIAGRIMAIRLQGKAGFAQIQQGGQRLQIYVRKDDVGDDAFALYKLLDLGDHIGLTGYLMRTRTGELTVHAGPVSLPGHQAKPPLTFLAKAMLALPDKFHGLEDTELRYRQRYVDLFMSTGHSAASPKNTVILSGAPERAAGESNGAQSKDPEAPTVTPAPPTLSATITGAPGLALADLGVAPPTSPETESRNVREVFVKRAAILRAIRRFFDERGYLEVETPMLHTIAGGAAARPFKTHHNALDIPLSLRIAPELFLKRLVVGGLDRVYEINRNFRNEGVSTQHNPEFTMLEFYQAYSNYHDLMDLTKKLISEIAIEVNGTTKTTFNDIEIDLAAQNWRAYSMLDSIVEFQPDWCQPQLSGIDLQSNELAEKLHAMVSSDTVKSMRIEQEQLRYSFLKMRNADSGEKTSSSSDLEKLANSISGTKDFIRNYADTEEYKRYSVLVEALDFVKAMEYAIDMIRQGGLTGKVIAHIFEAVAEPHLIQPTIIYDFPLAVSPLSKKKPSDPEWVERFEFYIGGFEVGNAFSELNDPDDQRRRFEDQLKEKERGDDEAHAMDEDYVRALGYGLPPTAGEGIGIDRLTMILTGSKSIRDVILFPLMRPHTKGPE